MAVAASSEMSRTATKAPLAAQAETIAAPMPEPPPVTTTTLPASEKSRSTGRSAVIRFPRCRGWRSRAGGLLGARSGEGPDGQLVVPALAAVVLAHQGGDDPAGEADRDRDQPRVLEREPGEVHPGDQGGRRPGDHRREDHQ